MATLDCFSRDEMKTLVRTNLRGTPQVTVAQAEHISSCLHCAARYMAIYALEYPTPLMRDVEGEETERIAHLADTADEHDC